MKNLIRLALLLACGPVLATTYPQTVQYAEDAVAVSGDRGNQILCVRADTPAATGANGDYVSCLLDNLGKLWTTGSFAEDAAHVSGDTGTFILAVRQDTLATLSSTTGDYEPFHLTSTGRLWTSTVIDTALPAGTNSIGNIGTVTPGTAATNLGKAEDAVHADGDTGVMALGVRRDANTSLVGADGDYAPIQMTALGAQKVAITEGGAAAGTNTAPSTDVMTVQTARANAWVYAAASGGITNTTAVTIKAAGGASVKNCVTSLQIINGHATVSTEVLLRDGAAGTTIGRWFAQAAGGGAAIVLPTPICGTANTLLEVVNITTGSAVYVNAQGFTGN